MLIDIISMRNFHVILVYRPSEDQTLGIYDMLLRDS